MRENELISDGILCFLVMNCWNLEFLEGFCEENQKQMKRRRRGVTLDLDFSFGGLIRRRRVAAVLFSDLFIFSEFD